MTQKPAAKSISVAGFCIALALLIGLFWAGTLDDLIAGKPNAAYYQLQPNDPAIVASGQQIYADQCAACHGVNLEGEPNWRTRKPDGLLPAPPHDETGHTWHHSDKQLFEMTKIGAAALIQDPTYQTAMPIYDDILTDAEIVAVLSYIKSTWPQHVRDHHDRLNGPVTN